MATRLVISIISLLLLARLGAGEPKVAERVPMLLQHRQGFFGGISLYATTPDTGEDGVCPSYTQTCPDSCCPDGCCPMGTFCFVNGDYCCPTDSDCSAEVDSAPSCANSTWIMYARPATAVSPFFCCEPDQIALLPNLCVPNNGTYATSSLAPLATQIPGISLSTSSSISTTSSGTSSTPQKTGTSSNASAASTKTGRSSIISPSPSIGTGTPAVGGTTTAQKSTGTSSVTSTAAPKAGTGSSIVRNSPWEVAVIVLALGFGMALIL